MSSPQLDNFLQFTADQWEHWLETFVFDEPLVPAIPRLSEAHHDLVALYEKLDERSCRKFSIGLREVLISLPRNARHIPQFYHLLQVAAVCKPPRIRNVLFELLRHEVMVEASYARTPMQSLILVVLAKYDIDEDIAVWVERASTSVHSIPTLLIFMRLLSKHSGERAVRLLEHVIPLITARHDLTQIATQLGSIVDSLGCQSLFRWHKEHFARIQARCPMQAEQYKALLGAAIVPWATIPTNDVYRDLLSAEAHLGVRTFAANDLISLARCSQQDTYADVYQLLQQIWDVSRSRNDGRSPWTIVMTAEMPNVYRSSTPEAMLLCEADSVDLGKENETAVALLMRIERQGTERATVRKP